jgi:hypothetical protein
MKARIHTVLVCFALIVAGCAESELAPADSDGGRIEADASFDLDSGANSGYLDTGFVGDDSGTTDPDTGGEPDLGGEDDAGQTITDMGMGGDDAGVADMGDDAGPMPGPCDNVPSSQGWEAVGGALSGLPGGTDSLIPDIAIDGDCRPVIAFHEAAVGEEENVFVYRWEGGAWQPLGGALDATGQTDKWTTGVRIATFEDEIYVMWAEITPDNAVSVFVAQWNGTSWDILGNTQASGLLSFDMSLVIDPQGRPVAAWNARDGFNMPTQIRVARWESPNWIALGGPIKDDPTRPAASALSPELVIDANGNPVVAWSESSYLHTRRWNGSSWAPVNGQPIDAVMDPSGAFDANLALTPNGEILYGWRESAGSTDVYVESWDGANFSVIANALDAEPDTSGRTNTGSLDIAVDSQSRTIIVFNEPISTGGRDRVHVFRHDATGLARLGAGILDVNVGDTASYAPQVALDPIDRVYVVFIERGTQSADVHVWRYTD